MKTENVAESHQTDIPHRFLAGHETSVCTNIRNLIQKIILKSIQRINHASLVPRPSRRVWERGYLLHWYMKRMRKQHDVQTRGGWSNCHPFSSSALSICSFSFWMASLLTLSLSLRSWISNLILFRAVASDDSALSSISLSGWMCVCVCVCVLDLLGRKPLNSRGNSLS